MDLSRHSKEKLGEENWAVLRVLSLALACHKERYSTNRANLVPLSSLPAFAPGKKQGALWRAFILGSFVYV